ncbi:MAG: 23S rRNA (guanosine(2251)-2'-O)-methyltransferase RlmB [Gammaproteobacteria bacterium]
MAAGAPRADIVCGFHALRAALARERVLEVWIAHSRDDRRSETLRRELARAGIPAREAAREQLDQLAGGLRHQGVVARVRASAPLDQPGLEELLESLARPALLLILDQVQDPHNLGACLRSAAGAGADAVLLPQDRACGLTPAAVRVSAGGSAQVPLCRMPNLARAMDMLRRRGVWLVGADAEAAEPWHQIDFTAPTAIVLGAEGRGLRRLTRERCDHLACIPMAGQMAGATPGVSSLNVSVAAGVFLFEARRQRAQSNNSRYSP